MIIIAQAAGSGTAVPGPPVSVTSTTRNWRPDVMFSCEKAKFSDVMPTPVGAKTVNLFCPLEAIVQNEQDGGPNSAAAPFTLTVMSAGPPSKLKVTLLQACPNRTVRLLNGSV